MPVYQAEPIDISSLKTLLEGAWETYGGAVPKPTFYVIDVPRADPSVVNGGAVVNIFAGNLLEQQLGYAYQHASMVLPVTIDIFTNRTKLPAGGTGGVNRQYLHDVKAEVRRILYSHKHALEDWLLIIYDSFQEEYQESVSARFKGTINVRLEHNAKALPTELVSQDTFVRDDAATLGAGWTVAGTWGVDGNLAKLQTATADAVALYAPSGATFRSNQRVQVDVVTSALMSAGVVVRRSGVGNYWVARLVDDSGHHVQLVKFEAGVPTVVADVLDPEGGWTDGQKVELAVNLNNAQLQLEFNGANVANATDDTFQAATGYGLYSDEDQDSGFSYLSVFETGGSAR